MRAFNVDRELGSGNVISWNHQEFEVYVTVEYLSRLFLPWLSTKKVCVHVLVLRWGTSAFQMR